jgi:hypothetical protein
MTAALLDSHITATVRLAATHLTNGKLPVPARIREQFAPDAKIRVDLIDAFGGSRSLGTFTARQTGITLTGITWPEDMRADERVELSVMRGGDSRWIGVYIDTTPAPAEPPKPESVQGAVQILSREIVATAQINGGTRVVELSIIGNTDGRRTWTTYRTAAYDSNHPNPYPSVGIGPADTPEQIEAARADASTLLDPSGDPQCCDCWSGWDPYCGKTGCWGVYRP